MLIDALEGGIIGRLMISFYTERAEDDPTV